MTPRLTGVLLLALILPACILLGGRDEPLFAGGKTFYLDSNLGFTWAYPADWKRSAGATGPSVLWSTPVPENPEETIRVEVTAIAPSEVRGGYSALMEVFNRGRPNFTPTSQDEIQLSDGTGALEILGHTPARSFLVCFVTSYRRAFILTFSLPPEHVNRYLPLFRAMVASFRVLD